MILGEPTFQTLIELIEDVGCPHCEQLPEGIQINGPEEIVLGGCGHVIDATKWIDTDETQEDEDG